MKKIKTWVKSVLPPNDRNVGWIDMSDAAHPVKKVWENGGYTTVTEESSSSGTSNAAAAFTVAHSPIGVAKISVESNSNSGEEGIIGPEGSEEESYTYTIDEFIDIDTFVSDMGEFWQALIPWRIEMNTIYQVEQETGEEQEYPDTPDIVSKYVDSMLNNPRLNLVYNEEPNALDFANVMININDVPMICSFGAFNSSIQQVENNKYIIVPQFGEESGAPK